MDKDVAEEPFYGLADENYGDKPKKKDSTITEGLRKAHAERKSLMEPGLKNVMRFPFVSSDPVCEYTEPKLYLNLPFLGYSQVLRVELQ